MRVAQIKTMYDIRSFEVTVELTSEALNFSDGVDKKRPVPNEG